MRRDGLRGWCCIGWYSLTATSSSLVSAASPPVALLSSGSILDHDWVHEWLGSYVDMGESLNGRLMYAKAGDATRLLWHTERGFWHFGHAHDVQVGAGMIAVQHDSVTPDDVPAATSWAVVAGPSLWVAMPTLFCAPAPPAVLWLFGHTPLATRGWLTPGWVGDWLGAYELDDEIVNGHPRYAKRGCKEPCDQVLWFSKGDDGAARWLFGPQSSVGEGTGLMLVQASQPHLANATWYVAMGELPTWELESRSKEALRGLGSAGSAGGAASEGVAVGEDTWIAAPFLRCTAVASEVLGFYASLAHAAAQEGSREISRDPLGVMVRALAVHAAGALDEGLLRVGSLRASLRAATASLFSQLTSTAALALGALPFGSSLLEALHEAAAMAAEWGEVVAAALSGPLGSVVATCCTWAALVCFESWRQRRWQSDEDETEVEVDETEAGESSEEKKLAFACLSDAIEEVKGNITEQQYMALYSAAMWCFNLTPHWASALPDAMQPASRQVGDGAPAAEVPATTDVPPCTLPSAAAPSAAALPTLPAGLVTTACTSSAAVAVVSALGERTLDLDPMLPRGGGGLEGIRPPSDVVGSMPAIGDRSAARPATRRRKPNRGRTQLAAHGHAECSE